MDVNNGGLSYSATLDNEQFMEALAQMRNGIRSITDANNDQAKQIESNSSKISKYIAGALSVAAIKGFVSEMIDVRGEFQQIENAIETITGSQEKMNSLMTEWKSLTLRSPFRLSEIAQSGKQLLAMGIATQDVTKDIEMLANVASGVSAPVQDIAYVFGQVKTQGKAMSQDLNQFAGRGIPIIASLAKVLNTTDDNVKNLASQSKISFDDINSAFQLMTSSGGQFYNLIGKQADTLPGQINRLKHEIELMFNELGEKSEGFLGGAISGVSFLVEHYDAIGKVLIPLIATYGTYKAAILATMAIEKAQVIVGEVQAFLELTKGLSLATKAQEAFNLVSNANPYVLIASAIVGVATAIYMFSSSTSEAEQSQKKYNDTIQDATANAEAQRSKLVALISVASNEKASLDSRKKAISDLNAISPKYLGHLNLQNVATMNAKTSVDAYVQSLIQQATAEAKIAKIQENTKKIAQLQSSTENDNVFGFLWKEIKALPTAISTGKSVGEVISDKFIAGVQDNVKTLRAENDKLTAELSEPYNDTSKQQATVKNKAYWEAQKKTAQDGLDGLADTSSKEAQKYKAQINEANAKLKYYDVAAIEKQGKAAESALEKSNERLRVSQEKIKSIMDEINGVNDTYSVKFSDDEFATQSKQVMDAIGKIKDEIVKFNADPKNKIKISDSVNTRLDNLQSNLLSQLNYSFQTDLIKKQLDEQKTDWENYEKARVLLGQEAALKLYGNDKAQYKSYLDYVQSQQAKEFPSVDNSDDITHRGVSVKPDDLTELTAAEKARLKMREDVIKATQKAQNDSDRQQAEETLKLVQTTAEKVLAIQKKYQKQKDDLQRQGLLTPERSTLIDQNQEAEFDSLNESLKGNQEKIAQQAKNIAASTKQAIENQIVALRKYVNEHTELTDKEKNNIQELIKQLGILEITATNNPNTGKNIWDKITPQSVTDRQTDLNQQTEQVNKLKNEYKDLTTISENHPVITPQDKENAIAVNASLEDAEATLKRMQASKPFLDMADYAAKAQEVLSDLSSSLEGFGGNASYITDNLSKLAGSISSIGSGIGKLTQGNPLGVIDVAKGIGSVFSLGKSIKAMNAAARAEQKKFYDEAIAGELKYQALLRQRAVTEAAASSRNSYKSTLAQLKELQAQAPEVQAAFDKIFASLQGEQYIEGVGYKHGTLLRKAKTWDIMASLSGSTYDQMEDLYNQGKLKDDAKAYFEQLQSLKEEMDAAGVSAEQLQESLDQMFVGSDLDSFVDQFKDITQQMLSGTADLGASIEDILKNSILNAFKYKYLSDQLEPLYDSLAKALEDGDGYPTADFLSQWKTSVTDVMNNATDQLKYIQDQTGIDLTSSSDSNNLTGSIQRSLTEQTGDELAGLYRNNNDLIRQQLGQSKIQTDVMRDIAGYQAKIAQNTMDTVAALKDYLPTIADNTQGSLKTTRDIYGKL